MSEPLSGTPRSDVPSLDAPPRDGPPDDAPGSGTPVSSTRLGSIDLLRCIAGLGVMWMHLTMCVQSPTLRASGALGWVGVEIFFVVSGFVMPWAMHRARYAFPADTPRFVARRMMRLDPPYLVASAAAGLLFVLAEMATGTPASTRVSWPATLAHLGYLNGILGLPWYDHACWTLGIEFQFYLLLALLFPILAAGTARFLPFAVVALAGSVLAVDRGIVGRAITEEPWILAWAPCFLMGIAAWRFKTRPGSVWEFAAIVLLSAAAGLAVGRWEGVAAALAATLLVALASFTLPRALSAFAGITYSLYLVHGPVGTRVVRAAAGVLGHAPVMEGVALAAGAVASIVAAILFWRVVEAPALRWASTLAPKPPLGGAETRG